MSKNKWHKIELLIFNMNFDLTKAINNDFKYFSIKTEQKRKCIVVISKPQQQSYYKIVGNYCIYNVIITLRTSLN